MRSAGHVVSVLGCWHKGCSKHDGCDSCKRIAKKKTPADAKSVKNVLEEAKVLLSWLSERPTRGVKRSRARALILLFEVVAQKFNEGKVRS